MAPRANWKGVLKISEVACAVSLFTAASTNERIAFHILNRETGNRLRRVFVDSETRAAVEPEDQVKGYENDQGDYVWMEPDEISEVVPESDKTLSVTAFVACSDIDEVYLDRPYYLAPSSAAASEAFALIREGMKNKKVAALANTVLFRRVRTVLVRPYGDGLIANTLNFDYEIRSSKEAFSDIANVKMDPDMLDLAAHIIDRKKGSFDPKGFEDRYEDALAELVKAKMEGRTIQKPKAPKVTKISSLMDALRQSVQSPQAPPPSSKKRTSAPKAKKPKKAA